MTTKDHGQEKEDITITEIISFMTAIHFFCSSRTTTILPGRNRSITTIWISRKHGNSGADSNGCGMTTITVAPGNTEIKKPHPFLDAALLQMNVLNAITHS